MISDCQ